ncbi:MAG: hypothetical protein ACW981_13335 [Candidatus Hodarchaeales archaeon]|jgi:predicted ArsR family transcriptional regulator
MRKKQELLAILTKNDIDILELKRVLNLNPKTSERHIDQLMNTNLIEMTKIETNKWGIRTEFYRTTAKRYIVKYSWSN